MWVKLDERFPDHPKVAKAGPLASWLFVCGLAYCNRMMTDGEIPRGQIRRLADVDNSEELAATLVEVGLWHETDDGYQVHDYLDYQPSRRHIEAVSQTRAHAGRAGGLARSQANAKQNASNVPDVSQAKGQAKFKPVTDTVNELTNPSVSTDVLTSPQPGSDASVSTPIEPVADEPPQVAPAPAEQRAKPVTKPRYSAAYERLWERYPKPGRTDKAGAYAEYKRQQPPDDDLDAGLARWEASDRWAKGYIVSLKKWLHERRWEDEPEPASSARASPGRPLRNPSQEAADAVDRMFAQLEAGDGNFSGSVPGRLAIAGGHVASSTEQPHRRGHEADHGGLHAGLVGPRRSAVDGRRAADTSDADIRIFPGGGRAAGSGRDGP